VLNDVEFDLENAIDRYCTQQLKLRVDTFVGLCPTPKYDRLPDVVVVIDSALERSKFSGSTGERFARCCCRDAVSRRSGERFACCRWCAAASASCTCFLF
jgi:hypothetical protein